MTKVTIGEKAVIIGTLSLIGGCVAVLADKGTTGAAIIGVISGIIGAGVIGLLHKVRS